MQYPTRQILLLIIFITSLFNNYSLASVDTTKYLVVGKIIITGNKQTKPFVFRNEMTFWENDSLPAVQLQEILKLNESLLLKSALFNSVSISAQLNDTDRVEILINVEERWYIFPNLSFALTDRNFNEWWTEYNHDLSRTIYGASLYIDNVRGRAERLKTTVLFGFNQHFEISYQIPHLSPKSKIGLNAGIKYIRSKDVNYQTIENKLIFLHDNDYLKNLWKSFISIKYRSNIYVNHFFHLEYNSNNVADTVVKINPDFFLNGRTNQRYFQIGYQLIDDHRDIPAYPLHGYYFNFIILKKGISVYDDVDITLLRTDFTKYIQLAKNLYSEHDLRAQISFPAAQPYFNQTGLGYGGDLVRGYELHVINGEHFIVNRNTLKYKILSFMINKPIFSIEKFNNIPFTFFLTTHLDFGYAKSTFFDMENSLNNEYLKGAGIGIDFISYYDFTLRFNYSINRHKEKGLYLSFKI